MADTERTLKAGYYNGEKGFFIDFDKKRIFIMGKAKDLKKIIEMLKEKGYKSLRDLFDGKK